MLIICIILAVIIISLICFCIDRSKQYDNYKSKLPVSTSGYTPGVWWVINSDDYNQKGTSPRKIQWTRIRSHSLTCGDFEFSVDYNESINAIELQFMKTNGIRDWITNFSFPHSPYKIITYTNDKGKKCIVNMKVHHGWMKMYKLGKHQIRDEFSKLYKEHPNSKVYIVGWSLGGAMAQLCAQDINYNFGVKPILYTYGSPRPWFGRRTDKYVTSCIDHENSYQFENVNDIVSVVPPFFGWHKMKSFVVGLEKFNLWKMITGANKYHTIYDNENLYK